MLFFSLQNPDNHELFPKHLELVVIYMYTLFEIVTKLKYCN